MGTTNYLQNCTYLCYTMLIHINDSVAKHCTTKMALISNFIRIKMTHFYQINCKLMENLKYLKYLKYLNYLKYQNYHEWDILAIINEVGTGKNINWYVSYTFEPTWHNIGEMTWNQNLFIFTLVLISNITVYKYVLFFSC